MAIIAEDHQEFRGLLCRHLSGLAEEFIQCEDGEAAVAAFHVVNPVWAVVDWILPKLDGLEVTRQILSQHPEAKIVLTSIHSFPLLADEAKAAGAWAFVPKDDLVEMKRVVAQILEANPAPK